MAKKKTKQPAKRKPATGKSVRTKKKTASKPSKAIAKKVAVKPASKQSANKSGSSKTAVKKQAAIAKTKQPRPSSGVAGSTHKKVSKKRPPRIALLEKPKSVTQAFPGGNHASAITESQDVVTPLTAKELESFRELLLIKRSEIAGDVSALRSQALSENRQEASGDLSNMPIHMADLGTDNYEKEFTLGLLESERNLMWEIEEALKRIDLGTYGICLATGKQIGKNRLKAQPWVKYCYEYVLAQERGQAQNRW